MTYCDAGKSARSNLFYWYKLDFFLLELWIARGTSAGLDFLLSARWNTNCRAGCVSHCSFTWCVLSDLSIDLSWLFFRACERCVCEWRVRERITVISSRVSPRGKKQKAKRGPLLCGTPCVCCNRQHGVCQIMRVYLRGNMTAITKKQQIVL